MTDKSYMDGDIEALEDEIKRLREHIRLLQTEITPEMIDAGVEAYGDFDEGFNNYLEESFPKLVTRIFLAMMRARTDK